MLRMGTLRQTDFWRNEAIQLSQSEINGDWNFQAAAGLRLLSRLSEKLDTAPVIMLGDFNSPVDFAPYEFMKNGRLSKETVEKLERGEGRRVKVRSEQISEWFFQNQIPASAGRIGDRAGRACQRISLDFSLKDTSKHELTLLSVLPEAPEHSHSLASAYSTVMVSSQIFAIFLLWLRNICSVYRNCKRISRRRRNRRSPTRTTGTATRWASPSFASTTSGSTRAHSARSGRCRRPLATPS